MKDKVLRVRISEKFQDRIDEESEKRGISRSDFVRMAIENEIQKGEVKMKEEDKMCKIVEVVELNDYGVKVYEADNPYANTYFNDNGGLPDGNYNKEDIAGEWIVIDGQIEVNEDITYAHVTCSNTTLVKNNFRIGFDKDFAKEVDIIDNYSYITVEAEKFDGELEIAAGFHKEDGRITEIFLTPCQLLELLKK